MAFAASEHGILIVDDDPSIQFFVGELLKKEGFRFDITGTGTDAMACLKNNNWPGNVREMENLIQRAIILEDGDMITGKTIAELVCEGEAKIQHEEIKAKDRIETIKAEEEKKLIIDALTEARWKRTDAAARLGISRKSLFNKMKKYGLYD